MRSRDGRAVDMSKSVDASQFIVNVAQFARSLPREAAAEVFRRATQLGERRVLASRNAAKTSAQTPGDAIAVDNKSSDSVPAQSEPPHADSEEEARPSSPPIRDAETDTSVFRAQSTRDKAEQSTPLPTFDAPSSTRLAMAVPGFLEVAGDVMGAAVLGLLREVLQEADEEAAAKAAEALAAADPATDQYAVGQ